MARQKRAVSESGIYHIMLRGNNKEQIFFDDEDYRRFLSALKKCKELSGFKIYAYCLMNNHIHLLIKVENEPLDIIFKRFGARYVYWYNIKYKRVGNLFQSRFKSSPVNDDEYFISALRYIHQNPVKAGLVKKCEDYRYSSYNAYINDNFLVDTDFVFELMSAEEFKRIHREPTTQKHLEMTDNNVVKLTEQEASKVFLKYTHCKSADEFSTLPNDMQSAYVRLLKKQHLTFRQIEKLTGKSMRFISSN